VSTTEVCGIPYNVRVLIPHAHISRWNLRHAPNNVTPSNIKHICSTEARNNCQFSFAERTVTKLADDNSETSVSQSATSCGYAAPRFTKPQNFVPNIRANVKPAFHAHGRMTHYTRTITAPL